LCFENKPEYPLQFWEEAIKEARQTLPETSNAKAGDPNFWINYCETDLFTWQAPVVSPWLERYMNEILGTTPGKRVSVPLCGKSLDLKHCWMLVTMSLVLNAVVLSVLTFSS
jgi:hypothetical protein